MEEIKAKQAKNVPIKNMKSLNSVLKPVVQNKNIPVFNTSKINATVPSQAEVSHREVKVEDNKIELITELINNKKNKGKE